MLKLKNNYLLKTLFGLCILSIPIILLLGPFKFLLHSENWYHKEFVRYDVYGTEYSGGVITETIAKNTIHEVLVYFKEDTKKPPSITGYTVNENNHMHDVKLLIDKANIAFFVAVFIFFLSYFYFLFADRTYVGKMFLYGGGLTLSIAVLLSIITALNFNFAFSWFHKILFTGNYSFNPSVSLMKAMLPDGLFFDFGYVVAIQCIGSAIVLLGIGTFMDKRFHKKIVSWFN